MKYINKLKYGILSLTTVMLLATACNDKDANLEQFSQADGALLDMDFGGAYAVGAGSYEFTFDVKTEATPVTSVTVYKLFTAANGDASEEVSLGSFTTFPTSATYTIGELLGDVPVNGNVLTEADLGPGDAWSFRFDITMADGRVLPGRTPTGTSAFALNFTCPSDLAGSYEVFTTYGYHDFLPTESTFTIDAEITEVSDGVYSVFDFSGGLYSIGTYSSAYGTSSFEVTFSDVCGNITWTGQSDAWGPTIPLDGGENSVDANGVITISWFNEAYGENGVSVYTPK